MSQFVVPHRRADEVDAVCADVRAGRGAFVLVSDTAPLLLLLSGPKGMPWWPHFGVSPVPALDLRTMTMDLPAGTVLPADVPNAARHTVSFYLKLLGAWGAMG